MRIVSIVQGRSTPLPLVRVKQQEMDVLRCGPHGEVLGVPIFYDVGAMMRVWPLPADGVEVVDLDIWP